MNDKPFLIKIIPPRGLSVYKLELGRRHLAALAGLFCFALLAAFGVHAFQLHAAQAHVDELRAVATAQKAKLGAIDAQAGKLSDEIQRLERQNAEIRRAMGIQGPKRQPTRAQEHALNAAGGTNFAEVESYLARVAVASERARAETVELGHLAARILNVRHIERMARSQMLAAVPSLVPAGTGAIASAFGYRNIPWPEFHQGIDLEADYGDLVRAAAKGVVSFAGWDGGYGNKIDIDHGNGLHTWYCHLSKIGVRDGQVVVKGAPIGAVGSTGEATGPHLHYQVMQNGNPIDPGPFLRGSGAKVLGLDTSGPVRQ